MSISFQINNFYVMKNISVIFLKKFTFKSQIKCLKMDVENVFLFHFLFFSLITAFSYINNFICFCGFDKIIGSISSQRYFFFFINRNKLYQVSL